MNMDRVKLFVSSARHLSITRAAQEHRISQPAVSQQLKILQEEDLGVALFYRIKGRGIKLTESGRAFYEDAIAALLNVEQLKRKYGRKYIDSITIAATHHPSNYLLPALMTEFSNKHSSAKLTLLTRNSVEIEKLLLESIVDLAITTNPTGSASSFVSESYCREPLTAFVAASHPLTKMKSLRSAETGTIPVILKYRRGSESQVETQLSKFERDGLKFKIVMRCESPAVVKEFVRQGAGVGFLYFSAIKRGVERGEFKTLQIPGLDVAGQNYILYSKETPLSPLAREFLSLLRASVTQKVPVENPTHQSLARRRNLQTRDYVLRSKVLD